MATTQPGDRPLQQPHDGTHVELRHKRFPDEPAREHHTAGLADCFERLKEYPVALVDVSGAIA